MDRRVEELLHRFCRAFTDGNGAAAASCWEVPALIVHQGGTRVVAALREVEEFFGAEPAYHTRGGVTTRPEIIRSRKLNARLFSVQVRWPWLGELGATLGEESSVYLLRANDRGELKINCVVILGSKGQ